MNGLRPLLVSNDAELIDDVLRLAAANGVEVHLATDAEAARSRWQLAPLVLVGSDVAATLPGMGRRRDVALVSRSATAEDWQWAVAIGAEHVVSLPDGERWLIDRLADSGEGTPRDGVVVAVVGGGGGSGASTFAATLALVAAARSLRVLLVDCDPLGGGLDVLLGIEEASGIRWPDLADARGRLGAAALDQALPHLSGVATLSWDRVGGTTLPVDVLASVVDVGVRGYDLVVADLPRHLDAATELILAKADRTLVVAATHVRTTAAVARLSAELSGRCTSVALVLRNDPKGVRGDAVEDAVGIPLAGRVPFAAAVARRSDEGEPPSTRDTYGRAVADILRQVVPVISQVEDAAGSFRSRRGRRSA